AAADVSVRRAEFGDELANEVIEIGAIGNPGQQRFVTIANLLPIVPGHRGIPVEVTLDAPGFTKDLAPFFAWIDANLKAGAIELAFTHLLAGHGVHPPQKRTNLVQQLFAILVDVVALDAGQQLCILALFEIVGMQHVLWGTVTRVAESARFLRER